MLNWICLSKNKQSHGFGSSAFLQIRDTFNTCLWYSVSPVSPTYFNIDYYMAFSYHISYQPLTHISLWAFGPWANMSRRLIWHVIWKMPYHNLFIIYFNASFFIFVWSDRFQKPCSVIYWYDMMQCHIISTFLLYVFRDIINKLPLVEGVMVDYHTREKISHSGKRISPETKSKNIRVWSSTVTPSTKDSMFFIIILNASSKEDFEFLLESVNQYIMYISLPK
jgi:hypothetical protein